MITIKSYPNLEINYSVAIGESLLSNEIVKSINVDTSVIVEDEYIEVSNGTDTITLLITEECKYTPVNIYYFNKEGAQSSFTFFKKHTEDINITSNDFQSDSGQPLNGFHQVKRYNVQATEAIEVNSGFIDESNNEIIRQILLSTKIWKYDNGVFTPLIIKSKNLEYKTQQNDTLINYTLELDYAFNKINSI